MEIPTKKEEPRTRFPTGEQPQRFDSLGRKGLRKMSADGGKKNLKVIA
jgi:hypothetical protein